MIDRLFSRTDFLAVLVLLAGFAAQGHASEFLFVDDFENTATLTGRVLDTNAFVADGIELPVEGVVVTLLDIPGSSVTGPGGSFILRNVPPGAQVLDLDTESATPAPTGDGYAGFRERIVLQGFNNVTRPFYLPRIDATSLTTINPSQTTIVENPGLEISMTVVAGSAFAEDGQLFDGQLSISEVPNGLAPAALPDFLEPGLLITVQPVGVTFDPPAPITFPNFDNLPPGSETDLWSLDPELGQFAIVGTGQVSADGERIETISGGIIAADWHGPPPPPPRKSDDDDDRPPRCDDCCPKCVAGVGSSVDLFNGGFSETFRLPGVFSLNREFAPEFVYKSKRAFPVSVIPVNSGIVSRAATPNMISYRGYINDELVQDEVFIDTSTLAQATDEPFRVAVPFDNTARETGIHDADVMVTSIYDRSRISAPNPTALTVVNEADSPFGAGWSLAGLDRLVLDAPGTIRERLLLVQGDGGAIQFEEQLTGVNPDGIITILSHNDPTQPIQAGEISAIQNILNDMGHASQVVFRADFNQEVVDQSRMILFFDASFVIVASNADIQQVPDLLLAARANGMPLYFLGSEPANFRNFGNTDEGFEFIDKWLDLVHMDLASSSNGGQGLVNVLNTSHPIFDGPAGSLTQYTLDNDSDIARGSNTGETVLASTATADIVLVAESDAGGRTVVQNHTLIANEPVVNRADIEIVFRNTIEWLLDSPSISSGFFGEGEFAAVDGDYSGIVRDEVAGTFTRVLRDGTLHLFDSDGLMTSVIDRNGNTTVHAYDGQGRLQAITDPVGRVTTFAYDGNGHLDTVTDPAGRITTFDVTAAGNLVEVTFPDGSTRGFGYDARHLMTSQTSARGFTTQYEYDGLGFFTRSTQPDGSVRQVSPAQRIGLVDTGGGLGSEGNPAPIVRPETALSGLTDPEGRVLTADTGRFGEPVNVVGPDGLTTRLERDMNGNVTGLEAGNGLSLSRGYDALGNLVSETDETLGGTTRYEYAPGGTDPIAIIGANGAVTEIEYDAFDRPVRIVSPMNREGLLTYNGRGQLVSSQAPDGQTATFGFDVFGNVVSLTRSAGGDARTSLLSYHATGLPAVSTNALGDQTSLTFDSMSRLKAVILPGARVVEYDYVDNRSLANLTVPSGAQFAFEYDPAARLVAEIFPAVAGGGTNSRTLTRDAGGRLIAITRADGNRIDFVYDAGGALSTMSVPRGQYAYAHSGQTGLLVTAASPDNVLETRTYSGGRLTGLVYSGAVSGEIAFARNAQRRLEMVSVVGMPFDYVRDDDGSITQAGELALSYEPNTGGLAEITLGAVEEVYAYNDYSELIRHTVTANAAIVYDVEYERDALGRITRRSESVVGTMTIHDYEYDASGRLIGHMVNGSPAAAWSYDANSNRLNPGAVHDAQDRLTALAGVSFSHNAAGERTGRSTSGSSTTYDYDATGTLIGVTLPGGDRIDYRLDGLMRRVARELNGAPTMGLLYGNTTMPLARLDATGAVDQRYVYAHRDQVPAYIEADGTAYRVISDHVGSVRLVIDASTGVVAQRLDYGPWGRVLSDTNPGFQPFGFGGGLYDASTGLTRLGAREYDASTGRWTRKDPAGFAGSPINLYEYADSDPVNRIDPLGLETWSPKDGFDYVLDLVVSPFENAAAAERIAEREARAQGEAFASGDEGRIVDFMNDSSLGTDVVRASGRLTVAGASTPNTFSGGAMSGGADIAVGVGVNATADRLEANRDRIDPLLDRSSGDDGEVGNPYINRACRYLFGD